MVRRRREEDGEEEEEEEEEKNVRIPDPLKSDFRKCLLAAIVGSNSTDSIIFIAILKININLPTPTKPYCRCHHLRQ